MPLKLNKSILGVFALVAVSFASCDEEIIEEEINKTKTVFTNTCEPNQIWMGETTILKNAIKRSGEYSSKMDKTVEFGLGLKRSCSKISEVPPKKVIAGVWIYCADTLKDAAIVFSVDDEKGNIFWSGSPIGKSIKKLNEWVFVENTIEFPKELNPSNNIAIYAWNPKKEMFFLDDWKIEFSN